MGEGVGKVCDAEVDAEVLIEGDELWVVAYSSIIMSKVWCEMREDVGTYLLGRSAWGRLSCVSSSRSRRREGRLRSASPCPMSRPICALNINRSAKVIAASCVGRVSS